MQQECEALFARAHECSGPYIEGLVGVRIELDKPPGIAAEAEAGGKEALVAKAREEWEHDSQPAEVANLCARTVASVPPEQIEAMRGQAQQCMAAADCDAFATCANEMHRARLAGP